jgi:adenylate kinase
LSKSNLLFIVIALGVALLVYWYMKRAAAATAKGDSKAKVIFAFLGAPGSGKGTLADQCINTLGFIKLSTGDLCRDNIKRQTELGKKLQEYTSKGALVPDEVINGMAQEWLEANVKAGKPIILDGFPRTAAQAQWLVELLKSKYPEFKLRVVALNISDEAVVGRIAGRLTCSNPECKSIYNIKQFPGQENPVCEKCKAQLIRREDDKEEVVRARLQVYAATSNELIQFFKNAGLAIEEINVEGKEAPQVFDDFKKLV